MTKNWYTTSKEHDLQGLVCDESTGANIAVTYDVKDAPLVAASPKLLDALQDLVSMCNMPEVRQAMMKHNQSYYHATMYNTNRAISDATRD